MKDTYNCANLKNNNGLLEITFHTGGGPMMWSGEVHDELAELFGEIARDETLRVIIMTGTGDVFCESPADEFTGNPGTHHCLYQRTSYKAPGNSTAGGYCAGSGRFQCTGRGTFHR